MRIGIDARLWGEGGVGRYIRNLVKHLQELDRKNEYVLFILRKDEQEILKHPPATQALRAGVQNDKGNNFRRVKVDSRWHTVEEQLRFPSLLNKYDLDLVHFPYPSVPIFYQGPFVVTIHDLIPYHYPTGHASTLPFPLYWIKQLGYRLVLSQAIKKAKKIIAVSEATKSEITDRFGATSSKIVVTYEGVDKAVQSSKFKVKSLKKENSYFLYVGNAYPHKNLERLLEAFRVVCHLELFEPEPQSRRLVSGSQKDSSARQRRPQNDIRLILVGKDDYFYKRLQESIDRLRLNEQIVVRKNISDTDLARLYQHALALIAPSLMEGFDLPVVEAMVNGCLVLASDIPVHREVAGDTAIYFNPYNTQDILKKLKAVHSNNTYHYSDRIQKGLERAKVFSWEKMAIETLRAYESCVGV